MEEATHQTSLWPRLPEKYSPEEAPWSGEVFLAAPTLPSYDINILRIQHNATRHFDHDGDTAPEVWAAIS